MFVFCSQIQAMPAGMDNLVLVSQDVKQKTFSIANQGGGGVDSSGKKWKLGELEFEAQMRILDNAVSVGRILFQNMANIVLKGCDCLSIDTF